MAEAQGGSRVGAVCAVAGVAFLALILLANPVGDALAARGVPPLLIGIGMTVLMLIFLGIPIITLIRHRRATRRRHTRQQRRLLLNWAAGAQWQPVQSEVDVPKVLRRARLGDSTARQSFTDPPRRSILTWWRMAFSHFGSPVSADVDFLCLVTTGLRDDVWFGMGTTAGITRYALTPTNSPRLWSKLPPRALPLEIAQYPWGVGRTAIWPGPGTPTADALVEVAAELDAVDGWLLVHEGQAQVAVEADGNLVDPQVLLNLSARIVRLLRPPGVEGGPCQRGNGL